MHIRRFARHVLALLVAVSAALPVRPVFAAPRVPSDPYFGDQTYLAAIGAPEAWNTSLGFEGVPIAIIDTGVDIRHPDLKDNIWTNFNELPGNGIDDDLNGYIDDVHGWDFVGGDADPSPDLDGPYDKLAANHGTIVAGIAAARGDNATGIVGVTWQSTIMPLRVLGDTGAGNPDDIVAAVEYAVKNGAKVINLSFVGSADSELLRIATRRAYDAGVLVVAAAGNAPSGGAAQDLDKKPLYPVCFDAGEAEDFIFGVAATDVAGQKALFSNYGAGCADIAAPGTRVISTQLYRPERDEFHEAYGGFFNGTSIAAPIVAGTAALLFAMDRNLTPRQVMDAMSATAVDARGVDPDYGAKIGAGRVDAAAAVRRIAQGGQQEVPPVPTDALIAPGTDTLVVTAPGPGRAPELRMFTPDGLFVRGWDAFPKEFTGGVSVDVGSFDASGAQGIVAAAQAGGAPQVRIFNRDTKAVGGFFAFDKNFRGGVSVAAGDVDGDGIDEIIAAAGPGGGPHVRIFTAKGVAVGGFFAFDKNFRGGVSVAAGDVDGDGIDEIIAAAGRGVASHIRIFSGRGELLRELRPFGATRRTGTDVFAADYDGDGKSEIAAMPKGAAQFTVLDAATGGAKVLASGGVPRFAHGVGGSRARAATRLGVIDFFAYERAFRGGVAARLMR